MKMQIAYLPGGNWMLVLSESSMGNRWEHGTKFQEATGAVGVFQTTEPVELDGEILLPPEGPTDAEPPIDPRPYVDQIEKDVQDLAAATGVDADKIRELHQTTQLIDGEWHPTLRPEQHATMTDIALAEGRRRGCMGCLNEQDRRA